MTRRTHAHFLPVVIFQTKKTQLQLLTSTQKVDLAADARAAAALKTKASTSRFLRDHDRCANAKLFSFREAIVVWARMSMAQCRSAQVTRERREVEK
jgi:hypothetical protein